MLFVFICSYVFAVPNNHKCPLCSSIMSWTGNTNVEWGKLLFEMKCPAGHTSWEVDSKTNSLPNNRNKNNNDYCQLCGNYLVWTGDTKVEWAKLLKKYRCAAGHIVWKTN